MMGYISVPECRNPCLSKLLLAFIHMLFFFFSYLPGCGTTPLLLPGVPPLGPVPAGGRRPAVAAQPGGGAGPPASPGPHQQGAGPPAVAHLLLPHPGRAAAACQLVILSWWNLLMVKMLPRPQWQHSSRVSSVVLNYLFIYWYRF